MGKILPNPDYMNIPSFSRSVSRGSAVGWFLVLLLVCGAGAGYYLYQDNLAKRKAAQELTAERKLKEKKAREAGETANKTGTGNQGEEGKGTAGGPEGL